MDFKDLVVSLDKKVDAYVACGRTPYKENLKPSDLQALKNSLQDMLNKLKK